MPITTSHFPQAFKTEIDAARKKVTLDEGEDTWDTIAQGILHLTRLCNNGGCEFPSEAVAGIRSMSRPLNNALNSERSRLSGVAIELVITLATGLGSSFEPLVSQFVPTLLALCGRTNKVFTSRAKGCILTIVQQTRLPSLLPYLAELANHKSVFPRLTAAEAILACLNCFNPPDLEKETRARIVEDFIKVTARDASADVRKASKEVFKAYKLLLPARVDSFVAPLTPVVKKYLDIQAGSSGIRVPPSNAGQAQASRPSSRANNAITESEQRPTSSTLPKALTRPRTDDVGHGSRQRPAAHVLPAPVAPRQRTTSQMQREPQPRSFHINGPTSGIAQRCILPTSAPAHQAIRPGAVRPPQTRSASSTGGPQRPPPMQLKLNPPSGRLAITGNGAKRIPLPPVPRGGSAGEQPVTTSKTVTETGSAVDKVPSKPSGKAAETVALGKSAVHRKVPEGVRSASFSTKATTRSAATGQVLGQRSHKPPVRSEANNPSRIATQQRPVSNVPKGTCPLVGAKRKETSPTLIPLPPSPSTPPAEIPLPPSPDCMQHSSGPIASSSSVPVDSIEKPKSVEAHEKPEDEGNANTPITALLSSIQRGFLFTPSSPLSPPQNYLPVAPGVFTERLIVSDVTREPLTRCISLEDDSAVDGLDRHALKDLN